MQIVCVWEVFHRGVGEIFEQHILGLYVWYLPVCSRQVWVRFLGVLCCGCIGDAPKCKFTKPEKQTNHDGPSIWSVCALYLHSWVQNIVRHISAKNLFWCSSKVWARHFTIYNVLKVFHLCQ